jgi:hypothetical protein
MRELIPDAGLVRWRPPRPESETADFDLCGHRQLMGLLLELDQHLVSGRVIVLQDGHI